jgi:hypothetical protein
MLRGPDAYALLVETLQSADDAVRLAAAWGLSKQPEAAAVPALALVLHSSDPQTRVMALETLGESGALEAGLPLALATLDDPDLEVRYAAALTWVELAGEAALPGLAARILQARGAMRACFAKALFHATNYLFMDVAHSRYFPAILEALEAAVCDDDPETRLAASMPLAWLHDPACDRLLETAFQREPLSETRIRMLTHAVHLSSPVSKTMLKAALLDADEDVRQTAVYLRQTYRIET